MPSHSYLNVVIVPRSPLCSREYSNITATAVPSSYSVYAPVVIVFLHYHPGYSRGFSLPSKKIAVSILLPFRTTALTCIAASCLKGKRNTIVTVPRHYRLPITTCRVKTWLPRSPLEATKQSEVTTSIDDRHRPTMSQTHLATSPFGGPETLANASLARRQYFSTCPRSVLCRFSLRRKLTPYLSLIHI